MNNYFSGVSPPGGACGAAVVLTKPRCFQASIVRCSFVFKTGKENMTHEIEGI